jgi:hypothetical protein
VRQIIRQWVQQVSSRETQGGGEGERERERERLAEEALLASLPVAERFLAELSLVSVPPDDALTALLLQRTGDEEVSEIRRDCVAVTVASKELRASEGLRQTLGIILAIGNRLNRSAARGFKPDTLLRLSDTRANVGSFTLLHYVVASAEKVAPGALSTPTARAFPHLAAAAKISLADASANLQRIDKALSAAKRAVDACLDPLGAEKMRAFLEKFGDEAAEARSLLARTTTEYTDCVSYFGADPRDPANAAPADFFGTFATFFDRCMAASKELAAAAKKGTRQ